MCCIYNSSFTVIKGMVEDVGVDLYTSTYQIIFTFIKEHIFNKVKCLSEKCAFLWGTIVFLAVDDKEQRNKDFNTWVY